MKLLFDRVVRSLWEGLLEVREGFHNAPLTTALLLWLIFVLSTALVLILLFCVGLMLAQDTRPAVSDEFWKLIIPTLLGTVSLCILSFILMRNYWRLAKTKYPSLVKAPS